MVSPSPLFASSILMIFILLVETRAHFRHGVLQAHSLSTPIAPGCGVYVLKSTIHPYHRYTNAREIGTIFTIQIRLQSLVTVLPLRRTRLRMSSMRRPTRRQNAGRVRSTIFQRTIYVQNTQSSHLGKLQIGM